MTVRALVRRVLTERRYGMQPVGINGISHAVFGTSHHCMSRPSQHDHSSMCGGYVTRDEAAMERAYDLTARQWEASMREA